MDVIQAGRDLDVLIAERVMGWRHDIDSFGVGWLDTHGAFRLDEEVPPYSTDIAAAWAVVAHLQAQGALFRLQYGRTKPLQRTGHGAANSKFGPEWGALFQHMPSYFEASATADTAPLAICLAALRTAEEITS